MGMDLSSTTGSLNDPFNTINFALSKITNQTKLQLEMSNYCNAACPACARAVVNDWFKDMDYRVTINDTYISLEKFKSWISKDVWTDLRLIHM